MIRVILAIFFGSVSLLPAQVSPQTPGPAMASIAAQLAARISSLLPRHATVSLDSQTLTSIPGVEWSSFRKLLQDELRKSGVETVGPATAATQPESRLRITLSEDTRGFVFIAEVLIGANRQIAMLPWNPPPLAPAKPSITITKKLLWTEPLPILDIQLLDSDSQMLVLSTDQVASYRLTGNKWMPSATASLLLSRPMPRDPRGRLIVAADGFHAYLPGSTCSGALASQFQLSCAPGNENWPMGDERWVTDRNLLQSTAMRTPFFARAGGFYATADGRVQDGSGQTVAGAEGWGSDIAGIADPCGAGVAVIAAAANQLRNDERDEVRVFDIANGQATPASQAVPLPGPVTALWPAESNGAATLVVHNLQTGQYEASRLAVACTE
jgi:hypothetical protein